METLLVAIESNVIGPAVPYSFESWIVGDCNSFATEVARTFAGGEALGYSPLVIGAESGFGKTHLLHAIEMEARQRFPDRSRRFLSSTEFLSLFAVARRDDRMAELREELAALDMLVLDDVEAVLTSPVAEELSYIIERIQGRGGQVAVACEHAASLGCEIPRLRSRLAQGMVVELCRPDFTTRKAIVRRKSLERGIDFADEVMDLIARRLDRNVRELEGGVNRVVAHAKVLKREITLELVEDVLHPMLPAVSSPRVTVDRIKAVAASAYQLDVREIDRNRRDGRPVAARHIAMYLSCKLTDRSLPTLARDFHKLDHTTIMYARNKVEARIKVDPDYSRHVRSIEATCLS